MRSQSASLLLCCLVPLLCQAAEKPWQVQPQWVKAHEEFLASDALEGRGSATRDEAIAATYVASEFEGYGLKPAPGMQSFTQRVEVEQPQLDGHARLTAAGVTLQEGHEFSILITWGTSLAGPLQKVPISKTVDGVTKGAVVLLTDAGESNARDLFRSARQLQRAGAGLVILPATSGLEKYYHEDLGGVARIPVRVKGASHSALGQSGTMVAVSLPAYGELSKLSDGAPVALGLNAIPGPQRFTTNAMGFLAGSDKSAGTILITAHLDHLGVGKPVNGDRIYNGADDDAAGTTAVLELAHALAAAPQPKRSVLFVCFGSEELGGVGADYFREHPPVPLTDLVANLEFEMVGAQDPKMPKGVLLLSGWDRSNLGPTLKDHGARLGPDPYPEMHFFERSDNYALALKGVVAQTAAGWGVPPYYHQPNDDLSHLDFTFMTEAIQSMVAPLEWLANSDFKPSWNPGGKP